MSQKVMTKEEDRKIGMSPKFLDSSSVSRAKKRLPPLEDCCIRIAF
jgi:hypothetical protein